MSRRSCSWVFVCGALLLLSALALTVQINRASSPNHSSSMLGVAQVVSHLQEGGGCLTCHRTLSDSASSTLSAQMRGALAVSWAHSADPLEFVERASLHAVDARMLDLGVRLLALDEVNVAVPEGVVGAYLQTAQTRDELAAGASSAAAAQSLLQRLAALDALVRGLEHQASPYQVGRALASVTQLEPAALTAAAPSLTAVAHNAIWAAWPPVVPADGTVLLDVDQRAAASNVVYAVQRRGPPADAAYLDSVWSGRLLSHDMQSPFILRDHKSLVRVFA